MFKKIDHIGVIVKDIEEATALFSKSFGFKKAAAIPETDEQEEFKSALLVAGEANIELLEPTNPNGALASFLEKRGEGLHHISIEVDDIDQELEILRTKGVRLINKEAQLVGDSKLAFVHPAATKGILLELTEKVPK